MNKKKKLTRAMRKQMRKASRLNGGNRIPNEAVDLTYELESVYARAPYAPSEQQQPDPRHGAETRERVRTARRRAAFLTLCRVGVFMAAGLLCVAFWAAVAWLCCIFFPV